MNKKVILSCVVVLFGALIFANLYIFRAPEPVVYEEQTEKEEDTVIGFSQVGAESDWRTANSQSMTETFEGKGYTFYFEDAQQKQYNQITAIRKFIQQGVDYIVLAPVTETGWDTVLMEAKEANIPVIICDRMVDVEDDSLYSYWVGSDFLLEGKKAAQWLKAFCDKNNISGKDVHVVDIQGTIGATAQIGRSQGLKWGAARYGWDIVAELQGDFTQTKGYEVTNRLLKSNQELNVIYCENDNEALGAIKAIKQNNRKVGSDIMNGEIMIISFDGVGKDALEYALKGEISCLIECNPIHGPRVKSIIDALNQGKKPEKMTYVQEEIYSVERGVDVISIDGVEYKVTPMSQEIIRQKINNN